MLPVVGWCITCALYVYTQTTGFAIVPAQMNLAGHTETKQRLSANFCLNCDDSVQQITVCQLNQLSSRLHCPLQCGCRHCNSFGAVFVCHDRVCRCIQRAQQPQPLQLH